MSSPPWALHQAFLPDTVRALATSAHPQLHGEARLLRLRTFGGLSIERTESSSTPSSATAARRRLAILAVIAAAGPHGIPRDKLLAMFWPESDSSRARHALDQTLYALKRDGGGTPVVLGREELSLDPAAVTSDLAEFDAAMGRGDHDTAIALYTGPFLDGVYVPGAPGFDQWVDDERARLQRDAERALESLATAASERGDHLASARWWQRLAAMDMRKTRVVIALMSELAATGDRAAALRHAEIYDTLVRDELGAEPNPAVAALADKLRREPVKSESAVRLPTRPSDAPQPTRTVPDIPASSGIDLETAATPMRQAASPSNGVPSPRLRAFGVAAALVGLFVLTAAVVANKRREAQRTWVVLAKFENHSGDSLFDRALDAALATGIQQSAYVNVLPPARIKETLARMERPPRDSTDSRLDEALAREVAQRDGVHVVIAGSIDRVDSSYIITARLVDAADDATLSAEKAVAKTRADVIGAMDDLVRRLRRDVGESSSALNRHDLPLPEATTRSLEALRKYADGVAAASAGHGRAAIALWESAVALDSNFALAHAALGIQYYYNNEPPKGDAHFDRALALVGRLTDREKWIVRAAAESWRGNREHAIELRRALLAEYPNDPSAWGQIGYDYLRLDRNREAIDALQRQIARDSSDATDFINLATAYKNLGNFESAIAAYRRAFALQPSLLMVANLNNEFGTTLLLAGRVNEARAAFDTMRTGNVLERAQGERSIALMSQFLGRYAEAIAHLRQAIVLSHRPEGELTEARNRLFLAAAEREKGWSDSSKAELLQVHQLFRRKYLQPAFLMFLGKALARAGEPTLAEEVRDTLARRAHEGNPEDNANLLVVAGEIALARGHADSAMRSFQAAQVIDSSAFVMESLAHGLAAAGQLAESARRYEALASAPRDWFGWEAEQDGLDAPLSAATLYERLGDASRARAAYERQLAQWSAPDSDLVSLRLAHDGLKRLRGLEMQREARR